MKRYLITVILWLGAVLPATACPDGYYNACVLGACACMPNSGTVIKTIPGGQELTAQSLAPALQAWLSASRNSSRGTSSPMPIHIRQALLRWYPPSLLDKIRYKVGDNGLFNAARNVMFDKDVSAITLIDTIVFRSYEDSVNNIPLWAHEVFHVQQFMDWGERDFSIRYIRDSNAVEAPAYARENEAKSVQTAQPFPMAPFPQPPIQPFPIPPARFCQTQFGACQLIAPVPAGSGCFCNTPYGQPFGTAY